MSFSKCVFASLALALSACRTHTAASVTASPDQSAEITAAPEPAERTLSEQRFPRACTNWSKSFTPAMYSAYIRVMATPEQRLWFYLWHGVRNSWHQLTSDDREIFRTLDPAWEMPPARLLGLDSKPRTNNSGEDFLAMNHDLIGRFRDSLAGAGQPCLVSWSKIPDAKSAPVPSENARPPKTAIAATIMQGWETKLEDPSYLKSITLGELGYELEFTLLSNAHMRWTETASPVGERPRIASNQGYLERSWDWNKPDYDLLADTYAAPVNRDFWKIHGYVDGYVYRWLDANGYSEVADHCEGREGCYEWKGHWMGAGPVALHSSGFERFKKAVDLLRFMHKASRLDDGAIDAKVLANYNDPTKKDRILDPSAYVDDYVKHLY